MQIKVTNTNSQVIYSRMLDDSKTLNATVGLLMSQPPGTEFVTTVSVNGNDLVFRHASLDVNALVRKVEGIVSRTKNEVA